MNVETDVREQRAHSSQQAECCDQTRFYSINIIWAALIHFIQMYLFCYCLETLSKGGIYDAELSFSWCSWLVSVSLSLCLALGQGGGFGFGSPYRLQGGNASQPKQTASPTTGRREEIVYP